MVIGQEKNAGSFINQHILSSSHTSFLPCLAVLRVCLTWTHQYLKSLTYNIAIHSSCRAAIVALTVA